MKDKLKKVISRRIIVGFFLILYAFIIIVSTRSEYLQYKEIGTQYVSIFKKNIRTRYLVLGVCFVISYLIIYLSNLGLKKSLKDVFDREKKELPRLPNKSIAFIVSVIVAFIAQLILTEKYLMFSNVPKFGISDPVFGLDASFYMFQMPFIKAVLIFLICFLAILTIYISVFYIATLNICLKGVEIDDLKQNKFLKILLVFDFHLLSSYLLALVSIDPLLLILYNLH